MHRIDLQHCMACSGVAVGLQSRAYAARVAMSNAAKIDLANTIVYELRSVGVIGQIGECKPIHRHKSGRE